MNFKKFHLCCSVALCFISIFPCTTHADEVCQYVDKGTIKAVAGKSSVPPQFRSSAQCREVDLKKLRNNAMAKPEDINLKGNIRHEDMSSELGRINLRWPRAVESLFGRTPLRAMTEAASAVNRAIHQGGFPSHVQSLNENWDVVFMDEKLPEGQIPYSLVSNCHPGWMTPPANVYIVAQRVAAGCGGSSVSTSVADGQLARVLIHELGHAVEFHLLKGKQWNDRMRSEGFATWWEGYASQYSSLVNSRSVKTEMAGLAKQALSQSPNSFQFSGSAYDYARASLYFRAIEDQRGISGLMDVYKTMVDDNIAFFPAIEKSVGWNRERLEKEAAREVK